ncbi:hypothetical protein O0L34_g14153 [Tuta absoluta]|nr:hypothetical protein O0L34_g14153 [Tuta absoluta]
MNVLEKAEKALEYLKNVDSSAKSHDLQTAAGTLGRCLGALGSRQNCAKHYANLLQAAIPVLLNLASNDSAEVRLVGDEALNRAVVGGFAFHSYKTNILLQNQIDHTKNARWIRAALSRVCLGECWLRPGVGKIRSQAQTLFPKLTQIVRQTDEIQVILEALENNLPRLLDALADYTTDEEIVDLAKALLVHVESPDAAVRRGSATCVAHLVVHREPLITDVLGKVFEKLWPVLEDKTVVVGWFGVIKSILQRNDIAKITDNELFTVQDYLELYHICIVYLESLTDHNTQNAVMECLTMLLSQASGRYKKALLDVHPQVVTLDNVTVKRHKRNISSARAISCRVPVPLAERDQPELTFTGGLRLGSLLQLDTPSLSVEDLTIQTPDSPSSEPDLSEVPIPNTEQLTKDLSEKLQEIEHDARDDQVDHVDYETGFKINIGSSNDDDIQLKYCARLLASKFLLAGKKGDLISDRSVRVSVKASSLNCLSEILQLYPQAMTMYLDKDADIKCHNISGSSETDSNQDHINDFILERNVCFQDSLTNSLSQELLNRSIESHLSKKDSKSLDKSQDSAEQRSSSKDAPSNILDSRTKELNASALTDSTNPNMTNSNFTTNSNMTTSNDQVYPMSSSGDVLSSSIDLDMKFDHFGESTTNLDNLKDLEHNKQKKPLKRTDEVHSKDAPDLILKSVKTDDDKMDCEKDFEFQHMSDIFILLESHSDPQIRGLVRVCIGNYLSAALDLSHGDYQRWRHFSMLPKDVSDGISTEKLMDIVLKGLTDEVHSTVNHTLSSLTALSPALCNSSHWQQLVNTLNALVVVETNSYWLCRVSLCRFYEKLNYQKLFILYPGYQTKCKSIMDTLYRLLGDQDQKVRNAASQAIANIIPKIYIPKKHSPTAMVAEMAKEHSRLFTFDHQGLSLDLVRNIYFYYDLPDQFKNGEVIKGDSLKVTVGDIMGKLMASSCKYYSQGLLESLQAICHKYSLWKNIDSFSEQGILSYCIDNLDCCNSAVAVKTILLDICSLLYPVEIHNIMQYKTSNLDILERDVENAKEKWHHLDNSKLSVLSEKFLQVTLKMLNILVHLIEEVNPNVHLNKSGIALPGSPVRRKEKEQVPRKSSIPAEILEEKGLKKKPSQVSNLKGNLAGHFFNEPFYMKLYENLRAAYSNHKINLDPQTSMFHDFLSTSLNCLAIQLELSTEREYGPVTEEILYYLRVIMPLCPEKTVYCITQLLKCLFGTNTINQYSDFMSIDDKVTKENKTSFYDNVMMINSLAPLNQDSRRSSITSNTSQKLSLDNKNPRMIAERELLIKMETFSKNRMDRKWSTNKKELERYIRLFEPVVIQALKSYTMQNDIPLQCAVLCLLNQLLTLRVNYCMLDSDQIFIGFLMKQLDLVEQHEIPNCCDLVNSILMFLVQLSSSKHHSKQIIEIPKLIQLCDGLMASGAHAECIAGLEPVAIKVFSNMTGASVLGRAQQQEAQATREVLFYMLQKTLHEHKVLDLVSCVLSLSQEHPESYYRWSELASDTLLNLLSQRSIEIDTPGAISSLERLLDSVYKDVLLEQSRVEMLLKILFKAPPDQVTTPNQLKLRYLSILMILLRKVIVLIPESEILLTINYLKATFISPQSIFFNVKTDIDPLNVQNVNENCANLSPDVILVRFLFKTLTFAITELDNSLNLDKVSEKDQYHQLLYAVCVNIIIHVKHMLHLTNECLFPLTAKTAQNILHNEQSGLNTGLYSPEENIPLDLLNLICLRFAHSLPLLTVHWSHLLIRLNFLSHKYWQKLVGFARNLPLSAANDTHLLRGDTLQTACVLAYCEYFVENGLTEVVHLTWLLVNRVHILVTQYKEQIVKSLVDKVQHIGSASALLLQAIAARCQSSLKDEFALNTYHILSRCHETQSGGLVFLICRIIGKLEPAVAFRFAKLAIDRCKELKELPVDDIHVQLSKEDVQVALELLQRDKLYVRFATLVMELNLLASSVFDLSPLDLSQDRTINPQYIVTTHVDDNWLLNQIISRCCRADCTDPKIPKQNELAHILSNLTQEDLTTVMACPEFDRRLLSTCFKVACDDYSRKFLDVLSVIEMKETEKENLREQQIAKMKEEMTSSIDSNKLNVVNTLHVFKKSDNKESKSQFFIPITDESIKNFGNLKISDEEMEFVPPEIPHLYTVSLTTFDRCLTDVLRLFPKQNRPLSQSENFDLSTETIDRYSRRCHQVFQDKLFYREFIKVHTILSGFLDALDRMTALIDETDCDLLEKCIENILPTTLAKNIAIFSVISLQYVQFLIKNKKVVESPIHTDVSFRATVVAESVTVDNVIAVTIDNVSKALTFEEIWHELNTDNNVNRTQSAISCLYAIVKYLVKDTKPLTLQHYMRTVDCGPKSDIIVIGDKLITLIEYWEQNFYVQGTDFLPKCYKVPLESLVVDLSRLDLVSNIALIPPIAWSSVDVTSKNNKIDLPLQALQDLDVLEPFLFRVNLIGWSSKKRFEEMWVALLGALGGNGPHCAVRGITQLLGSAGPKPRRTKRLHVPRQTLLCTNGMHRLRNILVATNAYKIFENINLERVPLISDSFDGYHYAQLNADYLKLASEIIDEAPYKVRQEVKRMKKTKEVDVNSCLQLLMDVAAQMLEPKAPTGLACSVALLNCITHSSEQFTQTGQWCYAAQTLIGVTGPAHAHLTQYNAAGRALLHALSRCLSVLDGFEGLQELSTVHQKLLKSLTSSYAPLRQAALQGCLLQLGGKAQHMVTQQSTPNPYQQLVSQLNVAVRQYLAPNARISLYEQSLYWSVLYALIELGHPDLINIAVEFILMNPRHYCTELVVKGIISTIRQQVLPKELKKTIIVKLLHNVTNYNEDHAVQIVMVHLFSADNKLLSPKLPSDVSNMDPDVLMNSMERITLLYKLLKQCKSEENKRILTSALKYFLRETLPPAATLSRVVIEFLESCKECEKRTSSDRQRWLQGSVFNAEIVFEVFEAAVNQDQLPVLSGWLFEAICHLLHGKISNCLLPYCLLALLVSASSNQYIRTLFPLCLHNLKVGFEKCKEMTDLYEFADLMTQDICMKFSDRRLLCIVGVHSSFTGSQVERLKELCEENECLKDLLACLTV